jgi:hypothetical protein
MDNTEKLLQVGDPNRASQPVHRVDRFQDLRRHRHRYTPQSPTTYICEYLTQFKTGTISTTENSLAAKAATDANHTYRGKEESVR